jgi:hypothetical protein
MPESTLSSQSGTMNYAKEGQLKDPGRRDRESREIKRKDRAGRRDRERREIKRKDGAGR